MNNRIATRRIVKIPLDDPVEEHLQQLEPSPNRVDRQRLTSLLVHVGGQFEFERLNMAPINVGGTNHFGVVVTDPQCEYA
jgi:hypothetical protein